MQTGENEQALRKITDMGRLIAIVLLAIHCYYYCYAAFAAWQYTMKFTDNLLGNIHKTGLLDSFQLSKAWSLIFLIISLMGIKGRKNEKINLRTAAAYMITGMLIYWSSFLVFYIETDIRYITLAYIGFTGIGFILIVTGGTLITRIIKAQLKDDIFNDENETFPQEERLLENEYSINLPARYRYKGKLRNSFINFTAVFRSVIVSGNPGSGKSAYVIRSFITQALAKPNPYTLVVYDFKFPDLSLITYNHWLKNRHRYRKESGCYFINFDDLSRSHRCNPLDPMAMEEITDATESARTILLGLNPEWRRKQGEFFQESAINFVTAIIWFLRKYKDGIYCTLPHVIELIQIDYDRLFSVLQLEEELLVLVNPFIQAYKADVMEQLEGQIASAKIALARLSSPALYYVLSGSDFTLDINNPEHPKILCMGNNPLKIQIYGAVISLYMNRLLKILNKKGKLPSMLVLDEFPTITVEGIISTMATGRSNLICACLGIQNLDQLRKEYTKENADVIMNLVGNIITGQVSGDSAKFMSERIGKINQDRQSLSINSSDTSLSKNKQLEFAVPASKISSLSSGHFVGMVADTPDQPIALKAFNCQIVNDFEAINREERNYKPIPVIRQIDQTMVQRNFQQVKQDVENICNRCIERMLHDPSLSHLVIRKMR